MVLLATLAAAAGCGDEHRPPASTSTSTSTSTSGGGGGTAGTGGGEGAGGAASSGGGGSEPCGGSCGGATPLCDEASGECVACLGHGDCTEPNAARCDAGACAPCDDAAQCEGIDGAPVCDEGACVACTLGQEEACGEGQTCDLLARACVNVPPGSVQNCQACSHDTQCQAGHRCVPMAFHDGPHGHYCLKLPSPTCAQPYLVAITAPSLGGAAAASYCGLEEDLTTCEAVRALVADWRCTGTDGMCSPLEGEPEVTVPGAVCRQVGLLGDRCTYACATASECPSAGAGSTCGTGTGQGNGWCGG